MKLKIKVREITEGCLPQINKKGDWIDLRSSETIELKAPQWSRINKETKLPTYYIPLGISVQLPKGFEALVNSRSSTPNKMGVLIPSGQGVIDNSYSGNDDEWMYVCSPMRNTTIYKGDRICQFRIQLSQHATFWQKLKWLFSSGVKIVKVNNLKTKNRGGLGSTGIN